MKSHCSRFCSECKLSMFSIDEFPIGRLDLKETFQMGKGFCSSVGIFKSISLLIAIGFLAHVLVTDRAPLFYPAFYTAWGLFFSIGYLAGSLRLTASSSSSLFNETDATRLVKFTWLLFSMSSVLECVITLLYWGFRSSSMGPISVSDVTTHGCIGAVVLLQGLLVDHMPLRLKHTVATVLFTFFYLVWTVIQNVVIQYSPFDDDESDDDAIYDVLRWRKHTIRSLINALSSVFLAIPFFTIFIWALSLPGRRYLDQPDEESAMEETEHCDGTDSEVDPEFVEMLDYLREHQPVRSSQIRHPFADEFPHI
ncbi:unnamed protein product [Cylindrotheca closterium]|uniref:Transmembrane protein n=1 Tax=Cylindrotheca closterium TaxID=2856 RepID=A0AAD2CRY5_9STRA|nr:unnamed protein product [Cylindrotheca closterium]